MKVYGNYTAKKLKLPKRILFFAICAVAILIFALFLGNHLKQRMEEAEIDTTPIETTPISDIEPDDGIPEGDAKHDEDKKGVKAGFLDTFDVEDENDIRARIDALKNSGFNAVSFAVVSDGRLTYASRAIEEYTRLPASGDVISLEMLESAVAYAESRGMTTSAVFEKSASEELDMYVASELSAMGFDEIIIQGFENILGDKGGDISVCIRYVSRFRQSAGDVSVSVRLSPDAFVYARNSYHIEKLFTYTEFLSVDMTGYDADKATELGAKMVGSFSVYMIRPFISGESEGVAEALETHGVKAIQYATPIPEVKEETTDGEDK